MDSSSFDKNALMQSLMSLGPSMEELLLPDSDSDSGDGEGSSLAREEARLEREIVKAIQSGDWEESLRPNSGQAVAVGDHHVCVGFHHDRSSGYRVWEWHGHVMLFDEEDGGFAPEYVYGNYFQKLPANQEATRGGGLRDLIADGSSGAGAGAGRVLHRHVNAAASK